jgi:hypothetical protein
VVVNPNFNNKVDLIPITPLNHAVALDATYNSLGLADTAAWVTGTTPDTQSQWTTWQNGAIIGTGLTLHNTYYIAADGNDNNAGTIDAPFATLGKLNGLLSAGDTAYLRGGTYTDDTVTG